MPCFGVPASATVGAKPCHDWCKVFAKFCNPHQLHVMWNGTFAIIILITYQWRAKFCSFLDGQPDISHSAAEIKTQVVETSRDDSSSSQLASPLMANQCFWWFCLPVFACFLLLSKMTLNCNNKKLNFPQILIVWKKFHRNPGKDTSFAMGVYLGTSDRGFRSGSNLFVPWAWRGECKEIRCTPWKINMEPENDGLEDDFPFQLGDF